MKKIYIKFIEGDTNSLKKACKKLEGLGYKKWYIKGSLDFEGQGLLIGDKAGDYFTANNNEEQLIIDGHTEYKEEFIPGEEVCVSDKSIIDADDGIIFYYIGRAKNGMYVAENKDGIIANWEYCIKCIKAEEITMKQLIKELGRNIKIIK